jgi:hypothetical protein
MASPEQLSMLAPEQAQFLAARERLNHAINGLVAREGILTRLLMTPDRNETDVAVAVAKKESASAFVQASIDSLLSAALKVARS